MKYNGAICSVKGLLGTHGTSNSYAKSCLWAGGRVNKIHPPPLQLLGESPLGHCCLSRVPAVGHRKNSCPGDGGSGEQGAASSSSSKSGQLPSAGAGRVGRAAAAAAADCSIGAGTDRPCEEARMRGQTPRLLCLRALQFGLFPLRLSPPWTSSVLAFSFQSCHCQL